MADEKIDSQMFELIDRWPGVPLPSLSAPTDGFGVASADGGHNQATAIWPIGTKIQVRNHSSAAGLDGWSTFMYGKLEMQDTTNVLAACMFLTRHSDAVPYDLTNEVASDLGAGLGPLAGGLSAMTVDYFGWFWTNGVCPEEYVAALGTFWPTILGVTIGACTSGDLADADTTYGEIGLVTAQALPALIVAIAYGADEAV